MHFSELSRAYLDWFERASRRGSADPSRAAWGEIITLGQSALLRLSSFIPLLEGDADAAEETRDEYVVQRLAVSLSYVSACAQARRVPLLLSMLQQMIQLQWERFGGLCLTSGWVLSPSAPVYTHHNVVFGKLSAMFLSSLVDAGFLAQAERVVEALESMLREAEKPKPDAEKLARLPDVFRAASLPSDSEQSEFLLPAFLRSRIAPPSDAVKASVAGLGFTRGAGAATPSLLVNLRALALRYRAQHGADRLAGLRAHVRLVTLLERAERTDNVRPGTYSADAAADAAEAAEELNYLPLAEALCRRVELFFQPLADLPSLAHADLPPVRMLKVPFETAAQLTSVHGRILEKKARMTRMQDSINNYMRTGTLPPELQQARLTIPAATAAAATGAAPADMGAAVANSNGKGNDGLSSAASATIAGFGARFLEYYLLLQQRIEAAGNGDMMMRALLQQAHPLVDAFGRPYDALKKVRAALALCAASPPLSTDRPGNNAWLSAWRVVMQWHCLEGCILAEEIVPPQRAQALESFRRAQQVLADQRVRQPSTETPWREQEQFIRCLVAHIEATHAAPQADAAQFSNQLLELVSLQRDYVSALVSRARAAPLPAGQKSIPTQHDVSFGLTEGFSLRSKVLQELQASCGVTETNAVLEAAKAFEQQPSAAAASEKEAEVAPKLKEDDSAFMALQGLQRVYVYAVALLATLERASALDSASASASAAAAPSALTSVLSTARRLTVAQRGLEKQQSLERVAVLCSIVGERADAFQVCARAACGRIGCPAPPANSAAAAASSSSSIEAKDEDGGIGIDASMQNCAGCHAVSYCSRDCQKADWAEHKPECKRLAAALQAAREQTGATQQRAAVDTL
jgi:hypothetical protein